jgi:hypothetical protein
MRLSSLYKILKPPRGFRLTKSGKIFFGFLFSIIIIAMATGNNLLYLILAVLLAFMIVSGIESEMNLRHIEIARIIPSEIYSGTPASIGYLLRNERNRSERLILRDISMVKVDHIAKQQAELLHADITFPRRGRASLGSISIATTFPYGLFEKSITFDCEQEILVFPKPISYRPILASGAHDSGGGMARDSISHVRPYVPGDPLSSIVWKKQRQGLISRVLEGGSGMGGIVVLLPGPDLEQKLSKACFVINELFRACRPFGLVMNSYFSGIAYTRPHKIKILEQLSAAGDIKSPNIDYLSNDAQIIYI